MTPKSALQPESVESMPIASDTSCPIDFDHLRRYTLGDETLEREVLMLFCAHAPGQVFALKSAADETAWRDAAHCLKGSALAVGAWEVARGAETAELAARRFGELSEIVATLETAVERVRRFVTQCRVNA